MKKKFLKILALSSLMITGVGVIGSNYIHSSNMTMVADAAAYDSKITDSGEQVSDGVYTRTWTSMTLSGTQNLKANDTFGGITVIEPGYKSSLHNKGYISLKSSNGKDPIIGIPLINYADSKEINGTVTFYNESDRTERFVALTSDETSAQSLKAEGTKFTFDSKAIDAKNKYVKFTITGGEAKFVKIVLTYQEAKKYNVTFDYMYDGDNDNKNDTITKSDVSKGQVISGLDTTITAPTREGYIFDGWYQSPDFSGTKVDLSSYTPSGDATDLKLYAKWVEAVTITFTSSVEGKPVPQPMNIKNGGSFTEEQWNSIQLADIDATRVFDGWYDEKGNKVSIDSKFASDTTLTAKWAEPQYATGVKIFKGDVEINESEETIMFEPTDNITLSYKAIGNSNVDFDEKWSSDNPSAVSVDSNGKLTYVNYGLANITITLYPNSSKPVTCTVKVQSTKDIYDKTTKLDFAAASDYYFKNGGNVEKSGQSANRTHAEVVSELQAAGLDVNNPTSVFSLYESGATHEYKWNNLDSSCISDKYTLELSGYVKINAASAGTLKISFGVNKNPDTRSIYLADMNDNQIEGTTRKNTTADNLKTVDHEIAIPSAGEYKLVIAEKIWCESISFVEETHYFEPIVLQSQKGVVENKNVVNFVATISRDAAKYCKDVYFTLNINGTSNGQQFVKENYVTKKVNRVYTSYSYTKSDGTVETRNDATKAYFVYSLSGIPSDFVGEISAVAHSTDVNGQTKSSLVAVEKF